jgi:hypothetical protein
MSKLEAGSLNRARHVVEPHLEAIYCDRLSYNVMEFMNNNDKEYTREYVSLCPKQFHKGITYHRYPLHRSPETLAGSLDFETLVQLRVGH